MSALLPSQRHDLVADNKATPPWYRWAVEIDRRITAGTLTADQVAASVAVIARGLGSPDGSVAGIPAQQEYTFQGFGGIYVDQADHAISISLIYPIAWPAVMARISMRC